MAAARRKNVVVDYKQLNALSSVVLYDTKKKAKRNNRTLYEVERVIARRRISHGNEYLIKWKGWPMESCTWEPSEHLTPDLLRNFDQPPVTNERLQQASQQFACAVTNALRSQRLAPLYASIDLDVWRYVVFGKGIPSQHNGHYLYKMEDLSKFKYLPCNWWYNLDGDGNGTAVDFPIKAKPTLSWSPKKFLKTDGGMVEAKRYPIEKVSLTIIRKSCTAEQI